MYRTGQRAERIICLADLDCFFVEVERLHRPQLRGRAVVIGGWHEGRGVVSACSYEARRFGVRSGLSMAEAYKLVRRAGVPYITTEELDNLTFGGQLRPPSPQNNVGYPSSGGGNGTTDSHRAGTPPPRNGTSSPVVFMHTGLHGEYSSYSERVRAVLESESPHFRAKSIDEFEMDITGCERIFTRDHGSIEGFVEYVRARVRNEVGLPISVGIGPSRIVAKMASRHAKPAGHFRVRPAGLSAFLSPHDVQDVPGIGPATAPRLRSRGVETVGQLLEMPEKQLWHSFGAGMVGLLASLKDTGYGPDREELMVNAFGKGDAPRAPKSIGHESTFGRDVYDPRQIVRTLWKLTEKACYRLRAARLRARHITVKVRYNDFHTLTHGGFLTEPTDADSIVFKRVRKLFGEANNCPQPLRLLGVRLERLSPGGGQLMLFNGDHEAREERFFKTVDNIRDKYGREMTLVGPGVDQLKVEEVPQGHFTAGLSFQPQRVG